MTTTMTEAREPAAAYRRDGCVVVPGLFDAGRVERLLALCDDIRERWLARDPQTGQPGGDPRTATHMRHLNHPAYFAGRRELLPEILDACADERVLALLRAAWGEEPLFRCTSLFFNPTGIQQEGSWHRDTQFGEPDAAKERTLIERIGRGEDRCGVQIQIALVPSEDLEYVPGSHRRWDSDEELRVRRGDDGTHTSESLSSARRLAQVPGDGAFFDPSGLHRGRYHADRPRRAFMLTYTRSSTPCLDYFSTQPWCLEPDYLDGVRPATRALFERFREQYRDGWLQAAKA
jgi:hypothetical protein